MSWISIALLSHLCWAFVNIGDKYVVSNKVKNPYVYMLWMTMLGVFVIIFIPFINFVWPSTELLLWLILGAFCWLFAGFPYIKAMQLEDVSRINIWYGMIPVFSLFLAWWTIGEKLNQSELIALLILLLGTSLAAIHIRKTKIVLSKAFFLMLLSTFLFSVYAVILRYVTQFIPFFSAFIWMHIFMFVFASLLLLLPILRSDFINESSALDFRLSTTVFLISMGDHLGILFNMWALSLGPVALVYSMEGFQAIFVLLLMIFISLFTRIGIKEELDKKNLMLKIIALALMVYGIFLINLS